MTMSGGPGTNLYILKHNHFSCAPTATSSVPANTCCMSTYIVVYPGTHAVYLQTQHVLDVSLDSIMVPVDCRNYIEGQ